MTISIDAINKLGHDADLLTKSNEWLEHQRICILDVMQKCADDLFAVYQAQRIKKQLQKDDKIAAMILHRNSEGQLSDITINVLSKKDAVRTVAGSCNDLYDAANRSAQISTWRADGYNI